MAEPTGGPDRTSSTIFVVFAALVALISLIVTAAADDLAIMVVGLMQALLLVAFGVLARNVEDTRFELEQLRRALSPPPPARGDQQQPEPASRWEAVWQRVDRNEA